jgi:hypothetical protein
MTETCPRFVRYAQVIVSFVGSESRCHRRHELEGRRFVRGHPHQCRWGRSERLPARRDTRANGPQSGLRTRHLPPRRRMASELPALRRDVRDGGRRRGEQGPPADRQPAPDRRLELDPGRRRRDVPRGSSRRELRRPVLRFLRGDERRGSLLEPSGLPGSGHGPRDECDVQRAPVEARRVDLSGRDRELGGKSISAALRAGSGRGRVLCAGFTAVGAWGRASSARIETREGRIAPRSRSSLGSSRRNRARVDRGLAMGARNPRGKRRRAAKEGSGPILVARARGGRRCGRTHLARGAGRVRRGAPREACGPGKEAPAWGNEARLRGSELRGPLSELRAAMSERRGRESELRSPGNEGSYVRPRSFRTR